MSQSEQPRSAAVGPILITGATGKLGRIVTRELLSRGHAVRILTRRPDRARSLLGENIEVIEGDFGDPDSLIPAVAGIERLFLLSPISETLAEDQIAVIDAAAAAGVRRIVKISGSDWTVGTSFSGDAHKRIEDHLAATIADSVAIRPNAWAQVSLGGTIGQIRDGGPIHARHDARVAYIDIRDIADVAVTQLLADRAAQGPLVITGAEALTTGDIAEIATELTGRRVQVETAESAALPLPAHVSEFERGVIAQFYKVISAGGAAGATATVANVLGRQPRRVADYLAEELAHARA